MTQFHVYVKRENGSEERVAGPFDSLDEAEQTREDLAAENAEIADADLVAR